MKLSSIIATTKGTASNGLKFKKKKGLLRNEILHTQKGEITFLKETLFGRIFGKKSQDTLVIKGQGDIYAKIKNTNIDTNTDGFVKINGAKKVTIKRAYQAEINNATDDVIAYNTQHHITASNNKKMTESIMTYGDVFVLSPKGPVKTLCTQGNVYVKQPECDVTILSVKGNVNLENPKGNFILQDIEGSKTITYAE